MANILSNPVVIDDQTMTGYTDIGDTRVQWGQTTNASGAEAIVFPAPFANTNYSFNTTAVATGVDEGTVTGFMAKILGSTITTTGLTIRKTFHNTTSGNSGPVMHWQAFGPKP